MTRHDERKELLFVLFETFFKDDSPQEIYSDALDGRDFIPTEYVDTAMNKILENKASIDGLISDNLKGWTFDRITKVAVCILRISIYEMLYAENIPVSVSINEAVELAKEFGGSDDPSFINGVLSTVSKSLPEKDHE